MNHINFYYSKRKSLINVMQKLISNKSTNEVEINSSKTARTLWGQEVKYTEDIINAKLRTEHKNEIQAINDLKC